MATLQLQTEQLHLLVYSACPASTHINQHEWPHFNCAKTLMPEDLLKLSNATIHRPLSDDNSHLNTETLEIPISFGLLN